MSRPGDNNGASILVCLAILAAILGWAWGNNRGVDEQVNDCIARGGTPVVVGRQLFDDFKACVIEVQP